MISDTKDSGPSDCFDCKIPDNPQHLFAIRDYYSGIID